MNHRRPNAGRTRIVGLLLVLAAFASACGSRLPDDVLADIDAQRTSSRGAGDQAASEGDGVTGLGSDTGGDTADGVATGSDPTGGTPGATTPGAGGATNESAGSSTAASCEGAGATDDGVSADEITVGAIVTDSGPLPGATAGSFRGAQAYLAKVNAAGGVCGRRITLVKGDDGLDPQRARSEFLRLEPQVFAMVGGYSVADSGFADLIVDTGIPYFGTAVDPAARQGNVFPQTLTGEVHTGPFQYYRDNYPQVDKVGFVFADVGGVRANAPSSREALKQVGFEIVHDSGLSAVSPDFTADVIAMRDSGAQGVYLFALEVNMHVRFARNMRQQNFEPPLKVANIGYNSKLLELLGGIANGWTNHLPHLPVLNPDEPQQSPEVADFLTWNERVAPGAQLDLFPVSGWGATALFVEALRRTGGDLTRERLVEAMGTIERTEGGGLAGPTDPRSGATEGCFVIARVEGGQWVREFPSSGYECNLGSVYRFE